ncbi:LysR family transcriptional regulator [Paraclostridium ghonii]|uniref:DNA-binding transcriptional LysR family regulator n=1 Tax=Paraclostridium ghonii TaxID=29358 RepID=A0ABU0N0T4_9FIRM|nr:LysR family transcriptional regulator [Paeniclostridium ghonii]MDQ0556755.1 DNA-binding transcriptional LysR family regulator [Paeniclostridium ghonii]
MQINQLRYFIEVARTGSMNQAASNLFISQPNLSKAISNLEEEFKIKIFDRTNRGVKLTKEGKDFLTYATYIINQIDNLERIYSDLSQESGFKLEISSMKLYTLGVILSELYKKIESKKIKISLKETYKEKIIEDVFKMKSEIGIIALSNMQERVFKGVLENRNLEFNPICKDRVYIYISKNNPLYNNKVIKAEELNEYICVHLVEEPINALTYSVEADLLGFSNKDKSIYLNDKETITQFVLETNAYVVASGFNKIENIRGIRAIPLEDESIYFTVGWIKRKKEELSYEANIFLEIFLGNMRNLH